MSPAAPLRRSSRRRVFIEEPRRMTKIYDISLPIVSGGVVYPQNAPIEIAPITSLAAGGSSTISRISFGSHTATHVDPQSHFIDGGTAVDHIPPSLLTSPALRFPFPLSLIRPRPS